MLNKLWGFMILIGILFAAATGKIGEIGTAALDSSKEAVTLCITMLGIMSMWTGLMNIAKKAGYDFEILFLDAQDSVLVKRYKETRRSHPLAMGGRVDDGIRMEREKMRFLKERADYIIDTSNLLTRELKQEIDRIFVDNQDFCNMMISVLSFGFKYGIPADADLVFDVRFLPNPYYVDELRPLTGLDDRVFNYVMDCDIARAFADKLEDMINFLIPNYVKEGKTNLVIAIGCTGGKHRSVTLARELYSRLSGNTKYGFRLEHRDAQKDRLVRKQEG